MSRKLSFYQNISKVYLRLSILASSGLSNSKNFLNCLILNCLRKENQGFKIQARLKNWTFCIYISRNLFSCKNDYMHFETLRGGLNVYQIFWNFDTLQKKVKTFTSLNKLGF